MKAVVFERNKIVARRIARVWGCAGLAVTLVENPADAAAASEAAHLVGADAFDGEVVATLLRRRASLRGVLWTAETLERALRHAAPEPRLSHVFGRAGSDAAPRDWELLYVARRLARPAEAPPSFGALLSWGWSGFEDRIAGSAGRETAVGHVQRFVQRLAVPKRVVELLGELAHELIMNALYDAPSDRAGRPRFAHDRKTSVELAEHEAAILRIGSDGSRLALQVTDPFGRLERHHVFQGLARGLKGQIDTANGGAGLGMAVCHNATTGLIYDVVAGRKTEVTGLFDLDLNLRELRTQGRSLHYFGTT